VSIKITHKMLKSMGACDSAREAFKTDFPRGLTLKNFDRETIAGLRALGYSVDWFVNAYPITSRDVTELHAIRTRLEDVFFHNNNNEPVQEAIREGHRGITAAVNELRLGLVFKDLERVQHPVKHVASKAVKVVKKAVAKSRTLRAMKGAR